jgi:hypothetical protein
MVPPVTIRFWRRAGGSGGGTQNSLASSSRHPFLKRLLEEASGCDAAPCVESRFVADQYSVALRSRRRAAVGPCTGRKRPPVTATSAQIWPAMANAENKWRAGERARRRPVAHFRRGDAVNRMRERRWTETIRLPERIRTCNSSVHYSKGVGKQVEDLCCKRSVPISNWLHATCWF